MDSVLRLLGMAKKAGRLEIGEEPVGSVARAHQARVILLASDIADNSLRRANHFAELGNTYALTTPFTKEELGGAVGRSSCAMLAVCDAGFAAAMVKLLNQRDPEQYGEAYAHLDKKAMKIQQRQAEQRRHEKKLKQGGKKPWVAPAKTEKAPVAKVKKTGSFILTDKSKQN